MSNVRSVMSVGSSFIHSDVVIIVVYADKFFAVGVAMKLCLVTKLDILVKYMALLLFYLSQFYHPQFMQSFKVLGTARCTCVIMSYGNLSGLWSLCGYI